MGFREPSKSRASAARGESGEETTSGLALGLEWSSLLVVTLTVCILPWLLGGAIPKARLILQVGAAAAAVLTLLARLVSARSFALPPFGTWLLLGMAAIGIVQLQPWMPSAISLMNHSVHPEFRENLPPAISKSSTGTVTKRVPADSRSVAPAMTRRHVAQWIAVAVLLCVVADSLSRVSQLIWMMGLMSMNAGLLTILSLQQLFNKGSRSLSELWIISKNVPFGSFVNPNNASGWLLVHVAIAIGLVIIAWGKTSSTGWSRSFHRPTWRDQIFETVTNARHRLASLNNIQILSLAMVVLLLTGVAATLSRSGIVAGIFSLVVCAAARMQFRKSLLLLLPFSILLVGVSIFLTAFELDTLVLAELRTLKDPVSESTGRLLHWSDSLGSVQDFPLIGSGQGAYAWSALPYQRRGSSTWYINADNQYVEMLVESGVLGLTLFVGFGLLLTMLSVQLIHKKSNTQITHGLWKYRISIGLAGVAMMASQAIVAFYDFGIGLSSTMATIAVFGGVLTATDRSQWSIVGTSPAWYAQNGGLISLALRLAMVAAVSVSVPELRQADHAYPAIVNSARFFDAPLTRDSLEQLPFLEEQLVAALKLCPDDLTLRDSMVRVLESQFRLQTIDALSDSGSPVDDKQLQYAWPRLTPLGLADRIMMLRKNPEPENLSRLQTQLKSFSDQFPWQKLALETTRRFPLAPGLAVEATAGSICLETLDVVRLKELNAVRFTSPAAMDSLYQCGMICLISNDPDGAIEFWNQSLDVSENFRVAILVSALHVWTPEQALEMFASREYAATVRAALSMPNPELQERLWNLAKSQWPSAATDPTADQRLQHAFHLRHRESPEALLQWIDKCLVGFPETLELRRIRAETLEKQGKLDEAIGEWARYEHFAPEGTLPRASIQRLMDAKNK